MKKPHINAVLFKVEGEVVGAIPLPTFFYLDQFLLRINKIEKMDHVAAHNISCFLPRTDGGWEGLVSQKDLNNMIGTKMGNMEVTKEIITFDNKSA